MRHAWHRSFAAAVSAPTPTRSLQDLIRHGAFRDQESKAQRQEGLTALASEVESAAMPSSS